MAWINKEQLEEVRRIDLLTYFQEREPHELVHSAPGEYRTKSHGSLVMSKGKWCWNRGGVGGVSAPDYHYLSLGGTSDVALVSFLERNPQIKRISLCLDADDAGRKATGKIMKSLAGDERFSHIEVTAEPPPVGKDYNEALLHAVGLERAKKQAGHRRDAGFSI